MQRILLFFAALFVYTGASACDICGCSVTGNYLGILPQFQKHFIGMRYQYRQFESTHPILFPGETPAVSFEKYHTQEIWGRYVPFRRLHLFAFVPFNYFQKTESGVHSSSFGLGDISLMASFIVFNTADKSCSDWKHAFQIGGGVKLPTGKSDKTDETGAVNPNMQSGTGSLDYLANAVYTLRYKKAGINAEWNYRRNNANDQNYRFGDRNSGSLRLFYWDALGSLSYLPHAGINYEHAARDVTGGYYQDYTGGASFLWNLGLDMYYKNFTAGFQLMKPFSQHIGDGQIDNKFRIMANISYLF